MMTMISFSFCFRFFLHQTDRVILCIFRYSHAHVLYFHAFHSSSWSVVSSSFSHTSFPSTRYGILIKIGGLLQHIVAASIARYVRILLCHKLFFHICYFSILKTSTFLIQKKKAQKNKEVFHQMEFHN